MTVESTGQLYLWLSAALDLPDAALLKPEFAELGLAYGRVLCPDAALPETEAFHTDCAAPRPPEPRLLALQREHARLFIGPPQALIHPYESCFREGGRLMGDCTMAVLKFYAEVGIEFDAAACRDAPDHIVVELMALALLCTGRTGLAEPDRERREREFLAAHLGVWGPDFATRLRDTSRTPLYRATAELLGGLLRVRSEIG